MLETRELTKIYKTKKGVAVTALDKVSLKFSEKGMVFLLGKSGSGKSTLLNLLGGLDGYQSGEIIIKGVSSKDFKQKHFDSYRNTYVGFIFQEYNLLDDFTVGANIALAIELQNRKATDSEVNEILKEVDLEGFGTRKPNELSGGQKQRVAIARALVKRPQIIMADEPTGALDSNTGKAIFDTLKKLSKNRLVIVVSHDREFAEAYADRIIELADGRVISDVQLDDGAKKTSQELSFEGNNINVPAGYHITEEDRKAINKYIQKLNSSASISLNSQITNKRFIPTDQSKIISTDKVFNLIKSKLPLKNAFKIGAGSLKYKKIRLVITILLSCISFGLFGLADTFGAYNHIETCTNSLIDSGFKYVATAKSKYIGEGMDGYWRDYGYKLSESDLKEIKEKTDVTMHGVYIPYNAELGFTNHINTDIKLSETEYAIYNPYFTGFAQIDDNILKDMNFKILAGVLPDGSKNEIAISEYIFEVFKKASYTDGSAMTYSNGRNNYVYDEINSYEDMIGKKLKLLNVDYTVTAVIDTNFDIERYERLTEKKEHKTNAQQLVDMLLYSEFSSSQGYSYSSIAMVGGDLLDKLISQKSPMTQMSEGFISFYRDDMGVDFSNLSKLSDISGEKIVWIDGEKQVLGEKEIIVTTDCLMRYTDEYENQSENLEDYYRTMLKDKNDFTAFINIFSEDEQKNEEGYKIVGVIISQEGNSKLSQAAVCSDTLFKTLAESNDNIYTFCVGAMPDKKADIKKLVSYCYREDNSIRYQIQNSVTFELDSINEALKMCSKIFLYIGLGFALFASLMLANFIGISISHRKQEIGILRAIGSRSNDVFRIFFAESFLIAMINFILSATAVGVATAVINDFIRDRLGLLVTVLTFGPRQILLLFAVSILVAFMASYIPVKRIASKKPIDAIRDR